MRFELDALPGKNLFAIVHGQNLPAVKGVENNVAMAPDEVPGHVDSFNGHARAGSDEHIENGKRNRNAETGFNYRRQQTIARVVIIVGISTKSKLPGHKLSKQQDTFAIGDSVGNTDCQLPSPNIEFYFKWLRIKPWNKRLREQPARKLHVAILGKTLTKSMKRIGRLLGNNSTNDIGHMFGHPLVIRAQEIPQF